MASIDIIEEVRSYMGSKPVPKIDPNIQAPETQHTQPDLGNAIIPALLVGFYKHSRNENQAAAMLQSTNNNNILDYLFAENKNNVLQSVAKYTGAAENEAEQEMQQTASAIKEVLAKHITSSDFTTISDFFTNQRSNILKHLPPELKMGELMQDSSVDDRTNKMEGPMSGIMHTIEKVFSSTK